MSQEKILQSLLKKAWALERQAKDAQWPREELEDFHQAVLAWEKENPQLPPSHRISSLLSPQMSLRHFSIAMVPLERAAHRELQDGDFLPRSGDQLEKPLSPLSLEIALDHWRSAFNVGSVFRTADGLGVGKIHLWGYTPTPENATVKKTALGSEKWTLWSHTFNTAEALKSLRDSGAHIVAFETCSRSVPLTAPFPHKQKTVFIFGNERFGLNPPHLELCHEIREIPMAGRKNSLNAAVCAGLAVYEWKRQIQGS